VGVGYDFKLGNSNLFTELRFLSIQSEGSATNTLPIVIGLRFETARYAWIAGRQRKLGGWRKGRAWTSVRARPVHSAPLRSGRG
jgi:hypothetical protein